MTTSNAEAAARRAAHGLLDTYDGHCVNRHRPSGQRHTNACDRLTAYILTTETRLAAAEEAVREARAGALRSALEAVLRLPVIALTPDGLTSEPAIRERIEAHPLMRAGK